MVSWETGVTTTYGLKKVEERGILFCDPGAEVYEGMVVGEHQRPGDLAVNVCKKKHLTNMRAARGDMEIRLTPPRRMSLTTNCWKSHRLIFTFARILCPRTSGGSSIKLPKKRKLRL